MFYRFASPDTVGVENQLRTTAEIMLSKSYSEVPLIHLLRTARCKGLINSWVLETRHLILTTSAARVTVPVLDAGVVLGRMIHKVEPAHLREVAR